MSQGHWDDGAGAAGEPDLPEVEGSRGDGFVGAATPFTSSPDVDLLSAQLRADAADTDTFFAVLASKLAGSLGERVRLDRRGRGLRRREPEVVGIEVDLTDAGDGLVLRARREATGVQCTAARPVRGIVLSNRPVSMGEWVDLLVATLADRAARSEQARDALSGLLS